MKEIFEKILEQFKQRQGIAARDKYESNSEVDRNYYQGVDYGFYKAIEIVKQVAEEYGTDINVGSKWIPCKDRQPDKPKFGEDSYLVQERHVITPYSAYWDGECWSDSECEVLDEIIAWQPLPEPYKPKGE